MKTFLIKLFLCVWYFFATAIVLTAVLVSLARLMTPLLNQHHKDFEEWASKILQVSITISEVHANWRGYIPEISLIHVVTLDKQTHMPAFDIQEIKIGFQIFSSIWQRKIIPQDIIISGAHITLLQDAAGALSIKDFPLETQDTDSYKAYKLTQVFHSIFAQPYLAFYDIDVYFLPAKGEKREVFFKKVILWNKDKEHKISGNFILQQEIPTEFKMHIEWQGDWADPDHINAHAYFNVEGFSLTQWLKGKTFAGWQIREGLGGAEIWMDWENQHWQKMQSVFQWYDVEFYSNFDKKIYTIPRLSGHVGWKKEGENQVIAGDDILINFPTHLWPATSFYARLSSAQLQELRVGYLNIEDIQPILLANAGISQAIRKNITDISAAGEIQNATIVWRGNDLTDITKISLAGEFKNIAFHAWRQLPSLSHISGAVQWSGKAGDVDIAAKGATFGLPSLFEDTFTFDEVKSYVTFLRQDDGTWSFDTKDFSLYNNDLNIKTAIQFTYSPKASPFLDLNGEFSIANLSRVAHYLPLKIFDPELVAWLKSAFQGGQVEYGKVIVQGKLNQFPFADNKKSLFELSGKVKNMNFHYAPLWPIIREAEGHLLFAGHSMTALISSARILDIPIKEVKGVIPYLGKDKSAILNVQGNIDTDFTEGFSFIHKSPLEKTLGKSLAHLQMKGPLQLALSMTIPLSKPEKTTVLGKTQITQATLSLPAFNLTLEQLKGHLEFTEKGLEAKQLTGSLWGVPTLLQLKTMPSYIEATLQGKIDIAHIQTLSSLSLTPIFAGKASYRAQLQWYEDGSPNNQVIFSSQLEGISIELPAPFGKTVSVKRDFSLGFRLAENPPLKVQLKYGNLIQAQFSIALENDARIIDIDSSQIKGRIRLAYPFNIKQPLQAQLERLAIISGDEKTATSVRPQSLPPLVITSKQFIYGNKNLGQLALNTAPTSNGMIIQSFSLSAPDYVFRSKGQWIIVGKNTQQTKLQGTIESSRVNGFLDRLGMNLKSLIVNKGQAAFDLQWSAPPYGFSLSNMRGDFSFALERGRIINLDESNNSKMDVGKMLSVFSLQTIPRRLSLDFSDLFEKGYSFDFIRGDFVLKNGDAFTQKPATFDGPVARVTASGRIGLLAQDYDLTLSVSPYVTESLPLVAGAITLNPLVGAAAWVVNKVVLSKEVSKVATYTYSITGPWSNPRWQQSSSRGR